MALNNVAKKIDKARDGLGLAPDERVLAGCLTDPKAVAGMAVGGLVGAAVQAAIEKRGDKSPADGMASTWPKGRHMMAITSKRIIVCDLGALSGRPKNVVAQWPHSDVESFVIEKAKLTYPFVITFTDGSVVDSEGAKGTGADELEGAAAGIWT